MLWFSINETNYEIFMKTELKRLHYVQKFDKLYKSKIESIKSEN